MESVKAHAWSWERHNGSVLCGVPRHNSPIWLTQQSSSDLHWDKTQDASTETLVWNKTVNSQSAPPTHHSDSKTQMTHLKQTHMTSLKTKRSLKTKSNTAIPVVHLCYEKPRFSLH